MKPVTLSADGGEEQSCGLGRWIDLVFSAAAGAVLCVRPANSRIAVGRPGSDDHKVIQAMAEAFASESSDCQAVSDHDRRERSKHSPCLVLVKADLRSVVGDLECGRRADRRSCEELCCAVGASGLRGKSSKESPRRKSRA